MSNRVESFIDKIASRDGAPSRSRQGVQRTSALVEGSSQSSTDVIAPMHSLCCLRAFAFLSRQTSFLNSRDGSRSGLSSPLTQEILCNSYGTEECTARQYEALLATESAVILPNTAEGIARIAATVNERTENTRAVIRLSNGCSKTSPRWLSSVDTEVDAQICEG